VKQEAISDRSMPSASGKVEFGSVKTTKMAEQPWVDSGILRSGKCGEDEELLVFGYSCKLFRDDEKALLIDQGKHLIPWMGDESLKIDRSVLPPFMRIHYTHHLIHYFAYLSANSFNSEVLAVEIINRGLKLVVCKFSFPRGQRLHLYFYSNLMRG
jgi:hypothetical protein